MMKKTNAIFAGIAFSFVAVQVMAAPFENGVEKDVIVEEGYPSTFHLKSSVTYDTFCIQPYRPALQDSYGANGLLERTYNVEVGDLAAVIEPSLNMDEESLDNVKWLYAAYQEGVFNNVSVSSGWEGVGQIVQYAMWGLEGWNNVSSNWAWNTLSAYLNDTTSNWDIYEAAGWVVKGVEVSFDLTYNGQTYDGQNQLVGWKVDSSDPSEVPEPATMALFGLGLFGLAGAIRRKSDC